MVAIAPNLTDATLSHNVATRAAVDAVIAGAFLAGATVTSPAHETLWGGYVGYFHDPDGHLWEIVWNPLRAFDGSQDDDTR
jgi:uncharacterized glyoxalase superfamily protein PhnB